MKQLILDVETKKTFDEVGGYFPEKLEVSFLGVIERDGFPESGGGKEIHHRLFEKDLMEMGQLLESADVLVGFNIIGFDLPALQPYYGGNILKLPTLDLLDVIKQSAGHRISLDAVAGETLGTKKIGNGLDAIKYYQNGQLDKLAEYCMKDVEITRDLYDYGRIHGKVKFLNKWNNLIETPIDFSFNPASGSAGLQMTLI